MNRGGNSHWLTLTLRGKLSNRDGFGARVQVNGQARFATATGSYLSSNDKRLHFGLGSAETADIEIKWPSGVRQFLRGMKADQFLTVEELTSSLRSAAGDMKLSRNLCQNRATKLGFLGKTDLGSKVGTHSDGDWRSTCMKSTPRTKSYNASCVTLNRTSPGNVILRSSIVPSLMP